MSFYNKHIICQTIFRTGFKLPTNKIVKSTPEAKRQGATVGSAIFWGQTSVRQKIIMSHTKSKLVISNNFLDQQN